MAAALDREDGKSSNDALSSLTALTVRGGARLPWTDVSDFVVILFMSTLRVFTGESTINPYFVGIATFQRDGAPLAFLDKLLHDHEAHEGS
jgi:hypothetical protein